MHRLHAGPTDSRFITLRFWFACAAAAGVVILLGGAHATRANDTAVPRTIESQDFESATVGRNLAQAGWQRHYGNGKAESWKFITPDSQGNDSHVAVQVGGPDVQINKAFDKPNTLNKFDTDVIIAGWVRGQTTSGNTQPVRFTVADDNAHMGPFIGLNFDKSPGSDKYDLLRFVIDKTVSKDTAQVGHWYALRLHIHVDNNHPEGATGTLSVRDVTAGENTFHTPVGLKDVPLHLNRLTLPWQWSRWWLRGSYAGQIDNLKIVSLSPPRQGSAHPQFDKGPVYTPLYHEKFYKGERELYGYNPRFTPDVVTFDHENRPYIRTGKWYWGGHPLYKHPDAVIQTIGKNGQWQRLDFQKAIQKVFPWWDGYFKTGAFADQRIVFDKNDTAYMIVNCDRSSVGHTLFLTSKDHCKTWKVHVLPLGFANQEFQDGHNVIDGPPPVLTYTDTVLRLIVPKWDKDGRLELPHAVLISNDSCLPPDHSGGSNSLESRGGKIFIVWPGATALPQDPTGTPQYIAQYDRATGKLSKPVLLGFGHSQANMVDNHCIPEITIDSKGYLNVIFGAHHEQFQYTRSLKPLDIHSGWTKPQPFGEPKQPKVGSYSYVSLVCDQNDTLHVVGRWAGDGYIFRLVYLRKKAGQPWEKQKILVVPFRAMYSCWYQKLNIDRKGRLFLNYIYYGNQLSKDQVQAYRKKWPDEPIELPKGAKASGAPWYNGVNAHDPALLISDDGGDSWRLATTQDFVDGIEK